MPGVPVRNVQVFCNKHHKALQKKGRHHRIEDLEACIALAPKGELHACTECRAEKDRWVVNQGVNVRHGPRKELEATIVVSDEDTLQRLNVLGSMGVSCDIRKDSLHVTAVSKTVYCCEA